MEVVAVASGVAYLVLASYENLWCWAFAALSTVLYVFICIGAGLYAETGLQFYYLFMAGYGFYEWKYTGKKHKERPIQTMSLRGNLLSIAGILAGTLVMGYLLAAYTNAKLPYIDSFTTVGALVTTWMVAKKYLENWLYWIVVDSVGIYLYWNRGLNLTALLFAAYVVIVCFGYFQWKKEYTKMAGA